MNLRAIIFLLLLGVLLKNSQQLSLPSDPTYNAAVVEFKKSEATTPRDRIMDNLANMKSIIESDETLDLDIIVFPEAILNERGWATYLPDPTLKIAPCDTADFDFYITTLSCAARSRKLYLVINISEKEYCRIPGYKDACNASGINLYNTNVVFDRQGRVISRYRKTHLYRNEWYWYNVKSKPEIAKFETDFGVTFGHFICFDMLFYEPAQVLIKEHKITDIIYPTYWFSELPFLTAIQLQEGWAFANDVNLLAAGGSFPSQQNTGSGIYAGRLGRLNAQMYEEAQTKIIKAVVPKHDRRSEYQMPPAFQPTFVPTLTSQRFTKLSLLRDYNLDIFTTKLLPEDFTNVVENLCHSKFCCNFDVKRSLISNSATHSAYRYRLVAYDGTQTTHQRIDPSELGVCALVACTNDELYSCGHIFPSNVNVGNKYYFSSISVSGNFRNTARRSILPSSVDGLMMPLPDAMTDWSEEPKDTTTLATYKLKMPKLDLLTFGIWTNYYSTAVAKHNLDAKNFGSRSIKLNGVFIILLTIFSHFMFKHFNRFSFY